MRVKVPCPCRKSHARGAPADLIISHWPLRFTYRTSTPTCILRYPIRILILQNRAAVMTKAPEQTYRGLILSSSPARLLRCGHRFGLLYPRHLHRLELGKMQCFQNVGCWWVWKMIPTTLIRKRTRICGEVALRGVREAVSLLPHLCGDVEAVEVGAVVLSPSFARYCTRLC